MSTATVTSEMLRRASDGAVILRFRGLRGKSQNEHRGAHWSKLYKERDLWRTVLLALGRWPEAPLGDCTVTLTEWPAKGGRRRDPDNVVSACKWVLDALVFAGYLANDSANVVAHLGVDSPDLRQRPAWCGDDEGLEVRLIPR